MEAHEDTERDAVVDRITYHYVRAAELIHELGPVDGLPDDLTERALHWLEQAAARANQAEIPVVAERLYSEGLRLLGRARTAPATAPSSPAGPGPWPACARSRRPAPTRSAAVEESRQAGADGAARPRPRAAGARRHRAEGVELGGVRGRARRGRPRVRRRSATRPARPRCCASAASAP